MTRLYKADISEIKLFGEIGHSANEPIFALFKALAQQCEVGVDIVESYKELRRALSDNDRQIPKLCDLDDVEFEVPGHVLERANHSAVGQAVAIYDHDRLGIAVAELCNTPKLCLVHIGPRANIFSPAKVITKTQSIIEADESVGFVQSVRSNLKR